VHWQLLSGDYLFSSPDPSQTPSGYFLALTIAFGVIFVASALAWWRRAKLAPENAVRRRLIRRAAKTFLSLSAIGLFLALMRYVFVDYLDEPILMLLLIFSMIAAVGYFIYELSERYPLAVYQLQQSHFERQYRPTAAPRSEPQRARPTNRPRGKRRR
jgi:uncharacterized membrane protein YfcA